MVFEDSEKNAKVILGRYETTWLLSSVRASRPGWQGRLGVEGKKGDLVDLPDYQ
jgi:hypothetical protein